MALYECRKTGTGGAVVYGTETSTTKGQEVTINTGLPTIQKLFVQNYGTDTGYTYNMPSAVLYDADDAGYYVTLNHYGSYAYTGRYAFSNTVQSYGWVVKSVNNGTAVLLAPNDPNTHRAHAVVQWLAY